MQPFLRLVYVSAMVWVSFESSPRTASLTDAVFCTVTFALASCGYNLGNFISTLKYTEEFSSPHGPCKERVSLLCWISMWSKSTFGNFSPIWVTSSANVSWSHVAILTFFIQVIGLMSCLILALPRMPVQMPLLPFRA